MKELELKLLIDEAMAGEIWARAQAANFTEARPRVRQVKSTYVDTPDHSLRDAGISLRLRRDDRRHLQTVKMKASLHGGLSNVTELETTLPTAQLDFDAIPDEQVRDRIADPVKGAVIKPACTTVVKRAEGEVAHSSGTRAKLAIDAVEITAGTHSATFHELELEHVDGSPTGLFDIAKQLLPEGGVTFSSLSKAERGYLLAETGQIEPDPQPRYAKVVKLSKSQTAEQAAQQVLRECAAQIAANIAVVRTSSAPEGPHQLRIGLRRLRSALLVFKPVVGGTAARHLAQESQWLGQQVGQLRDLDVIINDIVAKEAKPHPDMTGFDLLADSLGRQAEDVRQRLRAEMLGPRVQSFLFDLMKFIETRGWIDLHDTEQTARLAAPVIELSGQALTKRWKKAANRAKGIQTLCTEERHALRKELKKLRYAVEFLAPLYPNKQVKPFLKSLKKLQDLFGELNDAAMVKAQLIDTQQFMDSQTVVGVPIGWIAGASATRAELHWEHAKQRWKALSRPPKFW